MPLSSREIFLRERQRRQNKVFAMVTMGMGFAMAVSLVLLSGIIPLPFGGFSEKVSYATSGDIPCPSEGAMPTPAAQIHAQVLNGTNRAGIAGAATEVLRTVGYTVEDPQNANSDYPGVVEISAGPRGVNDAWTLARVFPNARVALTNATDKRVLITLGTFYDRPIEADEATRLAQVDEPLAHPKSCLPLDPDAVAELEAASELADVPVSGDEAASAGEGTPDQASSAQ